VNKLSRNVPERRFSTSSWRSSTSSWHSTALIKRPSALSQRSSENDAVRLLVQIHLHSRLTCLAIVLVILVSFGNNCTLYVILQIPVHNINTGVLSQHELKFIKIKWLRFYGSQYILHSDSYALHCINRCRDKCPSHWWTSLTLTQEFRVSPPSFACIYSSRRFTLNN